MNRKLCVLRCVIVYFYPIVVQFLDNLELISECIVLPGNTVDISEENEWVFLASHRDKVSVK